MQQLTPQYLGKVLKATYSGTKQQIKRATDILQQLKVQKPLALVQTLVAIIQETNNGNVTPDMIPLKNSASICLKTATFNYTWQQQNSNQNIDNIIIALAQKLYQLLNTPEILSNTSRQMLSEALAFICLYRSSIKQQLTAQMLRSMNIQSDSCILRSLKQLYVSLVKTIQQKQQMQAFLSLSFPIVKKLFKDILQKISIVQNSIQMLTIVEDYFNLLDVTFQHINISEQEFGDIIHSLKSDKELDSIFISFLEIGFKFTGSVVVKQNISPHFMKINRIKILIFEILDRIYVIDPHPIINMCIASVLTCQKNSYDGEQAEIQTTILKCFNLLIKNVDFNQNFGLFTVILVHLLTKCLILSKSTQDQLMTMSNEPERFVETTQDYCLKRQELTIRMKSGQLIKALTKKIDSATIFLKTVCYDLVRHSYQQTQPTYDITKSQIFISSKVVKVQVALLVLAMLISQEPTPQTIIQIKIFLLETIAHFNEELEVIIQLRVINLIGYCLDMNYLPMIVQRMIESPEVIKYQAFSTLNRFLRQKTIEPGVCKFLTAVFEKQIELLDVQHYLFENIVLNNYSKLLSYSPNLKQACINKILTSMQKIASNHQPNVKQHHPFNMFHSIITLQTNLQIVEQMQTRFVSILRVNDRRQSTESNILDIMTLFLTKLQKLNQIHFDFATFIQQNFYEYYESREVFLYMNQYIYWNTTNHIPFKSLHEFINIKILHKDHFMSPLMLILGHILCKYPAVQEFNKILEQILEYYPQCKDQLTKGRIINVLLQGIISNHQKTLNIIGQNKYTQIVSDISNNINYFIQKIDKKICILGMCKILKLEGSNKHYNVDLLLATVKLINVQYKKPSCNSIGIYNYSNQQENAMEAQQQDQYQMGAHDDPFSTFDSQYYKKFLHILGSTDEFATFQQVWQEVKQLYVDKLDTNQSKNIRTALQIKTVNKKVRRIVKVKH